MKNYSFYWSHEIHTWHQELLANPKGTATELILAMGRGNKSQAEYSHLINKLNSIPYAIDSNITLATQHHAEFNQLLIMGLQGKYIYNKLTYSSSWITALTPPIFENFPEFREEFFKILTDAHSERGKSLFSIILSEKKPIPFIENYIENFSPNEWYSVITNTVAMENRPKVVENCKNLVKNIIKYPDFRGTAVIIKSLDTHILNIKQFIGRSNDHFLLPNNHITYNKIIPKVYYQAPPLYNNPYPTLNQPLNPTVTHPSPYNNNPHPHPIYNPLFRTTVPYPLTYNNNILCDNSNLASVGDDSINYNTGPIDVPSPINNNQTNPTLDPQVSPNKRKSTDKESGGGKKSKPNNYRDNNEEFIIDLTADIDNNHAIETEKNLNIKQDSNIEFKKILKNIKELNEKGETEEEKKIASETLLELISNSSRQSDKKKNFNTTIKPKYNNKKLKPSKIESLLDLINVNEPHKFGLTWLDYVNCSGKKSLLKLFNKKGAKPHGELDGEYFNAIEQLINASETGDIATLTELNGKYPLILFAVNIKGDNAFCSAAKHNKLEFIKKMIELEPKVISLAISGQHALYCYNLPPTSPGGYTL